MTIRNSLAQFSMILQTKGYQQALQGIKTQLSTTVGPTPHCGIRTRQRNWWHICERSGTMLQAFTKAGCNPDDVLNVQAHGCDVIPHP